MSLFQVAHLKIPTKVNGFNYFEIDGGKLESRTTYVVSVKSKSSASGRYSDSSEEIEFTTRKFVFTVFLPLLVQCAV